MTAYQVKFWNTYHCDETGNLVLRMRYDGANRTLVMDRATAHAIAWNRNARDYNAVNFITCDGHIRTIA